MDKLFFWHNWHAGDLILSRPLVRCILSSHDVQITWACLQNQAYVVEDLPIRLIVDPRNDPSEGSPRPNLSHWCPPDHVPIYLWVGLYKDTTLHLWETVVELYNRQIQQHGLERLRISDNFVPMADFPPIDLRIASNSVFIENGVARSKHSDFNFDLDALTRAFPDINFYSTSDPGCNAPNVVDCSRFNLRELSSISNQCIAIVGKGSGPFCSTLTEVNRYKPRAIMRYHPSGWERTIWDYPGNPMQYLETTDELFQFLKTVRRRKRFSLMPGRPLETLNANQPSIPEEYEAAKIGHVIEQYCRHPDDPQYMDALLTARNRLIQLWLEIPEIELEYAYRGAWGKIQRYLLRICAQSIQPMVSIEAPQLPPVPADGQDVESKYSIETLRYILAKMLLVPPHEFDFDLDICWLPDWIRPDVLTYLPLIPVFFTKEGDCERYFRFQERVLVTCAECLKHESARPQHFFLVLRWILRMRRRRFLLTDRSLKASQWANGVLTDRMLRDGEFILDHTFPRRTFGRKPRIGILSHSLSPSAETFATLPLFEHLGAEFDTTLYVIDDQPHPLVQYCASRTNTFRVLPKDLNERAALIRNDDLDILITSSNFASDNFLDWLNSFRLARIQISATSPATSGIATVDYLMSGSIVDRDADCSSSYSERVLRLTGSGLCWSRGNHIPGVAPSIDTTAFGLNTESIVFMSFACVLDTPPELINAWARILAGVPNSVLVMTPFHPKRCEKYDEQSFCDYVSSVFHKQGVASNRLRVVSPSSFLHFDELGGYLKSASVYLESFPVASPAFVLAALQHAIPVVARRAIERHTNLSASLIEELSSSIARELVGNSVDSYVEKAIRLGLDENLRRTLAQQIQQSMPNAAFLDSRHYASQLADQLRQLVSHPMDF